MARIRTYDLDDTIQNGDKVLGTDANGNGTKNFSIESLKEFIESGVNVIVPVPPGYGIATSEDGENVRPLNTRETLTQLAVDVNFYAAGDHDGENDNVEAGSFQLRSEGTGWVLDMINFAAPYNIASFEGKSGTGLWGSGEDRVSFDIGEIQQYNGNNWKYDADTDTITITFAITPDSDEISALDAATEVYTEFSILAADNSNETLQRASVFFYADVDMQTVHIDDLDVDRIQFDSTADDGIIFGDDESSNYLQIQLDNNHGIQITGNGTADIDIDAEVNIGTVDNHQPLAVVGETTLTGDVTIAGDITITGETNQVGDIYLTDDLVMLDPDHTSSIRFAVSKEAPVDGVTDQSDVVIMPTGIEQFDADGNSIGDIQPVHLNTTQNRVGTPGGSAIAPTNQGVLTQIQVGDNYYTVPQSTNSVAQILPGLSEGLSGADTAFTVGRYFYGIDNGTVANWKQTLTDTNLPAFNVAAGETEYTVTNAGHRTALNTAFNGVPQGQRLFFIESTNTFLDTTPADEAIVTGNVYEVVYYVNSSGEITFSLIGDGTIIISAPNIEMPNLTDRTGAFITIDSNDQLGTTSLEDLGSLQSTFNYEDSESATFPTGTVNSFVFEGDHALNQTAEGDFTIDVTGRLSFDTTVRTTDFTADIFHAYLLGYVAVQDPVDRPILTLPADPEAGDIVKIVNISDLYDADDTNDPAQYEAGDQRTGDDVGEVWEVAPAGTDNIMYKNENLVLNDASTVILVYSGNSNVGWVIEQ